MSFKEVRAEKQGLLDDIQQVLVVLARTDISDELRLAFTRSLLLFRKILSQLNELLRRMVRISIAQRQASKEVQAERSMTINSIQLIIDKLEGCLLNDRLRKLLTKNLNTHKRVLAQLNSLLKKVIIDVVGNRQITISRAKLRCLSYLTQQ